MPPVDLFEHLRRIALDGVSAPAPVTSLRRPRPRAPSMPEIPAGEARPAREELTGAMLHDAGRWWRRGTHAWVPSLASIVERGVARVEVRDAEVIVTRRNAVHRAAALPRPWVPVIVAALTGMELPAVRRALRAGTTTFTRETDA